MSRIRINEIFEICGASIHNIDKKAAVGRKFNISIDSRTVKEGDVYWAIPGERFDGHDFIKDALAKKPAFCVVQENRLKKRGKPAYPCVSVPDSITGLQELGRIHRKLYDIPVLALTGSNGKTTTKEMTAHILGIRMNVHKTSGNFNNHIGCPLTLLELNAAHQAAVIELGTNHPGEIGVLTRTVLPNHALITNAGGAHLEFFKTNEAIADEKRDLFMEMEDGGTVYLNLDDPLLADYNDPGKKIITYSLSGSADVQGKAKGCTADDCGIFELNGSATIQLQTAGQHNIKNALAASAAAINLGFSLQEIKDALESFSAADKRMQILNLNGVKIINDSYNANPLSMQAAFETIKNIGSRKNLYIVLGDMFELGSLSADAHLNVLKSALELGPENIFVMGGSMETAMKEFNSGKIVHFSGHKELADELKENLNSGDLVLIKGSRGMTMEKVIEFLK